MWNKPWQKLALERILILCEPPIFKRRVSIAHDVGDVTDGFEMVAALVTAAPHFVDVNGGMQHVFPFITYDFSDVPELDVKESFWGTVSNSNCR